MTLHKIVAGVLTTSLLVACGGSTKEAESPEEVRNDPPPETAGEQKMQGEEEAAESEAETESVEELENEDEADVEQDSDY